MTDRPIIFSAPMVRALLDERKSQTRRIIKPKPYNAAGDVVNINIARTASYMQGADGRFYYQFDHPRGGPLTGLVAGYEIGDQLWVREAWTYVNHQGVGDRFEVCIGYNADGADLPNRPSLRAPPEWEDRVDSWPFRPRKRPSIHMPRWASRLTLTVTDVRVQRLQDISEEDAIKEGCPGVLGPNPDFPDEWDPTPTEQFHELWNSLHGRDAWAANPWVVAIIFTTERRNIDSKDGA